MSDAGPLTCRKPDFRLRPGAPYLNCAYMGPLPRVSEEAGVGALARKRHPTDITPPDAFWESDRVRERFAALVGVHDPMRIAIHPGVSYGVATAARNIPVEPGQNLVLTHEQFPGNVYAWRRVAAEREAELRAVGPDAPGSRGARWNERLLEAIDSGTAVVAVPHVHWTDGTRFDLEAIGRRCREVGAALVVDGTQSVGALPFDVAAVRPDALVCAAYKWLLGPYSVAFSYFGPRFDDGTPLEETWIAREDSHEFQRLVEYRDGYAPGAVRYDVAERSNFFLLPIAEASLDLLHTWKPERIQEYCSALVTPLVDEARALGFGVEEPRWRASHLFGLRMPPAVDLGELRDLLAARDIAVSLRGTALRVSPNVYNDGGDVEALLEVLREATRG
ncbi:MAG: aminotransferase class V-fold PLP-dependent enzyme [Gemmatimonadota bacterium]|nr:aminotransferase class V-fold PLP-dependent enzyme [Gemmatimonadota bacterium]